MKRVVSGAMLVSALVASTGDVGSGFSRISTPVRQETPATTSAQDALSKRVSLDLKGMAPRDAFKVIASAIGYTVEVAPEVSTPVDIVVGNITARTALNTICESIGCTWQASGTVIHVEKSEDAGILIPRRGVAGRVSKAEARSVGVAELRRMMDQVLPADMKFDHAPLADVAARLSKATGFEIAIAGAPGQSYSGDLGGQRFSAALRAIGQQIEGAVATITIGARKGTGAPSIKLQLAGHKPRK